MFSQTALQWFEVLPVLSPAYPDPPRLVAGTCRCCPGCHRSSYILADVFQALPGASECHCIGPVNSGIWLAWDSGLTSSKHSQLLPIRRIHFTDLLKDIIWIIFGQIYYQSMTTKIFHFKWYIIQTILFLEILYLWLKHNTSSYCSAYRTMLSWER